jgi:hypothetical protein
VFVAGNGLIGTRTSQGEVRALVWHPASRRLLATAEKIAKRVIVCSQHFVVDANAVLKDGDPVVLQARQHGFPSVRASLDIAGAIERCGGDEQPHDQIWARDEAKKRGHQNALVATTPSSRTVVAHLMLVGQSALGQT